MEVQRLKTRGPNPNPTAQAQSKHCFPLSTKTQNIIENWSLWAPIFYVFSYFFKAFPQKCSKGSKATPQSVKRHQHGAARVPKWRQGVPNWSPEVPRSTKKTHKCIVRRTNVGASATKEPPSHSQCRKNTTSLKTRRKRLPRPGARRRRRRSGRGLEGRAHQAARRRPRSGAEAGMQGTSPHCLVSNLN